LALLVHASTLLTVVDPRSRSPFDRAELADDLLSRDGLIASFVDVDLPETTALLVAIGEMCGDDVLRARIRREVASRAHPLPDWLAHLDETQPYRTLEMVHVLRDGDNINIGVRLPSGRELSMVVYIDHNLGTLVKDAFVIPEPLDKLIEFIRAKSDDPDTTWNNLDPADARARIVAAIDRAAITFPPFETDTWPSCRPLVEWIVGRLPEGGRGYERPEWDDRATRALADRSMQSPFAAGLHRPCTTAEPPRTRPSESATPWSADSTGWAWSDY
jgi:hypothetical protein